MTIEFAESILRQPANLRRSTGTFVEAMRATDLRPFRQGSLLFTCMGASLFAAMPAVRVLRAGGRVALAVRATEVLEPGAIA
jgi:hypothetical protein